VQYAVIVVDGSHARTRLGGSGLLPKEPVLFSVQAVVTDLHAPCHQEQLKASTFHAQKGSINQMRFMSVVRQ